MAATPTWPHRGRGSLVLLAFALLLSTSGIVEATHFRYGTISWVPRFCPSTGNRDASQPSDLSNCDQAGIVVDFNVRLAFRRDYTWGQFFGEQWDDNVISEEDFRQTDDDGNYQVFDDDLRPFLQTEILVGRWAIRFPSGYSNEGDPIPISPVESDRVAGLDDTSGRLCVNPYDDGMLPRCNGTQVVRTAMPIDPRTNSSIAYMPWYVGRKAGVDVSDIEAQCSCSTVEEMELLSGACSGTCEVDCTTAVTDASVTAYSGGSTVCAPWAYAFGFFTGIEGPIETGNPDYAKTLDITLTEIDTVVASEIGNYIQGAGDLQVQYPTGLKDGKEPWVAYFTGGDRIGKVSKLQNNYGGRYRLEVSVNLECHYSGTCWQRSPRATSLPVVPVPYTARNDFSLYDVNFATIRIAAYDPDIGDAVYFFHASNQKYGVFVGHGIPDGDYPNNPTREEYNAARQVVLDRECSSDCDLCPRNMNLTGPGRVSAVIADFCAEYPEWRDDNLGVHVAGPPDRLMVDPYTGVIHWQTGPSPFADDDNNFGGNSGGYEILGPNPTQQQTPYHWRSPGTDGSFTEIYDGYVYDRATFSYIKYSEYSKCGDSASYEGDCTVNPLKPGFYNLVLDIRSQSADPCLEAMGVDKCMSLTDILTNADDPSEVSMNDPLLGIYTPSPNQTYEVMRSHRGYNSVPLDFLLYLYPAMSMCTGNCTIDDLEEVIGVTTYRDSTGNYGHDESQQGLTIDKYFHKDVNFQGTGRCTICGGAETESTYLANNTLCTSCDPDLRPATGHCVLNTRPFWINRDNSRSNDPYTPTPSKWGPTVTAPTGDPNDGETAWGNLVSAEFAAFKGTVVEFDLVAGDEDECVELFIYDTGLYSGRELNFCNRRVEDQEINEEACGVLDSNGDNVLDYNVRLDGTRVQGEVVDSNGVVDLGDAVYNLFDMYLGPHMPAYIEGFNDSSRPAVLGEEGKTVKRTFRWPVLEEWPDDVDTEFDPRPPESTVCFVAFDGYLFSDFRCVRITLNTQQQIYWSDRRPGLDPANSWNVVQDKVGFNTGNFTDESTDPDTFGTAPLTFANQTRLVVNVGDKVQFDVQAKQDSGYEPLDIFVSQGVLPEGSTFIKNSTVDDDPVRYTFSWRPKKGQECEYRICFLASNIRGSEYPMVVGYSDLVSLEGPAGPSVSTYTPPSANSATAPFIDERCYTIEVTDTAAYLTDGAYIEVNNGVGALVSALDSDCGYSVGGWFFPEESADDMSIFSVGHESGGAVTAVHQLRWIRDSLSNDIPVGTDNVSSADSGDTYRSLAFFENDARVVSTAPVACDGAWHYFYVTVDASNVLTVYLDGVALEILGNDRHEFNNPPLAVGTVSTFANSVPSGETPLFRFGADGMSRDFNGWLNDVRVYSRALTAEEVGAQMFATCSNDDDARDTGACLALDDADMAAAAKAGLELWLNFNDANNANPERTMIDNVVHGSTIPDPLPEDSSFSVYLSCSSSRDTRDESNWGGVYEYCNDYQALIGSRTNYQPDIFTETFRENNLPKCPEHMCYARQVTTDVTTLNPGSDPLLVCSYQCADADNSFHGSGFGFPDLENRNLSQSIPYVTHQSGGATGPWSVVGSLLEMDSPYSPYRGEMPMANNLVLADKSGRSGRNARAVLPAPTAFAAFEYKVSPQFAACPAMPTPNVMHVNGGQEIVVTGSNFAESDFLTCHFGGTGAAKARVVEYDNRGGLRKPVAIACRAPGGYRAATAAPLDVSNNAVHFSDFSIPLYFTEAAAYFDGTKLLEMDPEGASWLDDGFSIGAWFNMHEPPSVRMNGLLLNRAVQLFALEWDTPSSADDHLAVGYNVNGLSGNVLEVLVNGDVVVTVEGVLNITQGSSGWHHVMMSLSPDGEMTLFLDGQQAGAANVTMPEDDAKIWVGGRVLDNLPQANTAMAGYSEFVGYMDKLALFDRPVTLCEVQQFMWGNATRDYECPGGSTASTDKVPYAPLPSGLLAYFGFDGRYYEHGSKLSTPGGLNLYSWNDTTVSYDRASSVGEGWIEPVGDGVLIGGEQTNGVRDPDTLLYSPVLSVAINATSAPDLRFVTAPYLAPSFNLRRRKICGNVRIAVGSQATASAQTLSEIGNFMYADVNMLDTAVSGYEGGVTTVAEPMPHPNRCEEHHDFLSESLVPVEGLSTYTDQSEGTSCVEQGVTVYGFGFSKSPWLRCMQGDLEGNMSATSAMYISASEVRCTVNPTELPYKYKFAVTNNYLDGSEGGNDTCGDAPKTVPVETPEMLQTKDASLYFDGESTYMFAPSVSSGFRDTGVTFGAWFYPTRPTTATNEQQEPVVAFATECGSVKSLFDIDTAPQVAVVVGATYSNGQVCLTSDLPYYSRQEILAHEELDLPTTWDATFGMLDTTNSSLCLSAETGMWHYVEIVVMPKEILIDIPSDEPKVSYIATLTVDGTKIGDDSDGNGDASIRVPSLPLDGGAFFVGGLNCPVETAFPPPPEVTTRNDWEGFNRTADSAERFFQGMIDEVRVYHGVHTDLDWLSKAAPVPDLRAYYTFAVSKGDNQRRQTPYCDEFAGVDQPSDCLTSGPYFSRAVENYWFLNPDKRNDNPLYPRPTGYWPVARTSPLRPSVYPDLVTITPTGLRTCPTDTVSDASYAGTTVAHHNLESDAASFPLNFALKTKHPYHQGPPSRFNHFVANQSWVHNYNTSQASMDAGIYQGTALASAPDYRYMEVPWFAATLEGVSSPDSALDGGAPVHVSGYNIANSKYLACKFRGLKYDNHTFVMDEDFSRFEPVDYNATSPDTITCDLPGTATLGSDWLKVPSVVSLQLVNPKAVDVEMIRFREMALAAGGATVEHSETVYGVDNQNGELKLACPEGLRFDEVLFASYGRPTHRCNKQRVKECNGTISHVDCDWGKWRPSGSCDSDAGKPAGFTASIVRTYCAGKSQCAIPTKDEVFGDPCSGRGKWLAVAMTCTDRWVTKDYAILSDADATRLGNLLNPIPNVRGEYTFSVWVHPGNKMGRQAVASFGCRDCAKMNRGLLQWVGLGANVGQFHYYDDYINDVEMKREDGSDILLAANQWYLVTWSIHANNDGALYLNGARVASFSTASRPLGGPGVTQQPTFTLAMDLNDHLVPSEQFQGLIDEVRIFNRSLSDAEVFSTLYWTPDMGSPLEPFLVAYWKFNNMKEPADGLATDETANALHLLLPSSSVDVWDSSMLAFRQPAAGETAVKHVAYAYHGGAWFPATNVELDVGRTPAPLGSELQQMRLHGVNFVRGMSRVYYNGSDVSSDILEVTDTEVRMFVPAASCESGETEVYATNVAENPPLSIPEDTLTQEASVIDLQAGLTCYFPFLGSPMDWSGHGNDADVVDGAMLTTDRNGRTEAAYAFDGNDAISVPACSPPALSGKTIRTVAMWVWYADVAFPDECSQYPTFEAEIGFTGCSMEAHAIQTNAWKLIAGVASENGTVTVYVNGMALDQSVPTVPEYLDLLAGVMLETTIGGNNFVGVVDEVWVYDRPLCAAELQKLYAVESYALEMDGTAGGATAPIMAAAALGSPGLHVTLLTSTTGNGEATRLVVDLGDYDTSAFVHEDGTSGALDKDPDVTVPTTTDGYSLVMEGTIYAPHTDIYTLSATVIDEVLCTLKDDAGSTLMSINSGQPGKFRTHDRKARLIAGSWYALRCAYTKLPTSSNGHFALMLRSADGAVGPAFTGPHIRTGGASEIVASAWIHPYAVEGRYGVFSLMGTDATSDDHVARFGISIVDGALSAAMYTGDAGATCDATYYREHRSWKTPIAAGVWQHVVVAYDGMRLSFFLDGSLTEEVDYTSWGFIHMGPDAHFMLGADAAAMPFRGQVFSAALWNKVPADMATAVAAWWQCPVAQASSPDLILNLLLDEGVGSIAKDFSIATSNADIRLFGDAALTPAATWVDATCGTHAAHTGAVTYGGQALNEGLAGQCMVFSIQARDKCGRRRQSGGDGFTVEVVGPLHLHTEIFELTVGNGIQDMGDGTYLVHFTREISGYYLIYVKLDGVIVPTPDGQDATKTYVHPFVTDTVTTYMYDEEDMLGLNELEESCAGVPVAFIIQTVDSYNNLRTRSCDTDSFSVSFTGPYDMTGAVQNHGDGTFTVAYNAEVAGPWQMRVTGNVATTTGVETRPVYHYGSRTCTGWGQSELEYCTLFDAPPPVSGDDWPICLQVHECGSLRTSVASVYASFPDTDDLDLEGPFTMAAWVKPVPEAGQASRQYILSKQSEYSGKGYWLALLPGAAAGSYTLELGVYVGSENYRIVKEMASMPEGEWSRVGAVYDGTKAWLFVNGAMLTSASWDDEAALFQRRNAQPLRVGKAFSGHIDDVMMWSVAEPAALSAPVAGRCPVRMADTPDSLIAYYRFNEGAMRDEDGQLSPQYNAWATKDSSGKGNDGFVGLFSDETGQNKEMTIRCPAGYVVGEILFANYGSSKGGYGTYEVDECGADNSMSYVEQRCLKKESCKVLAAYTVFGNPCKHASKSLAVNAVCMLRDPDPSRASWAIGDPAPTHVGVPAPPAIECPYSDMDALPAAFRDALPAGESCSTWNISAATVGSPEYFLLRLRDECGYVNRYPQKVDQWVRLVNASIPALGGADLHEPVFANATSGMLVYPNAWMPPSIEDCAIMASPAADALPVHFHWGGSSSGYPMYCRRHADKYLGTFTPTAAHASASLQLNLGIVDGAVFTSLPVDVAPAPIDAANSTTCAPGEVAPECESMMCEGISAEAGVEAMFEYVAKDMYGNRLRGHVDLSAISIMVSGGESAIHRVMPGSADGVYEVFVIFPHSGIFNVTMLVSSTMGCTFTATVTPAVLHTAVVYGESPAARFEHSMVSNGPDLYIFGGADKSKTYLAETWKLATSYSTFAQGFHYRRSVAVQGVGATGGLLPVSIPTRTWMAAGKLQADCADILFVSEMGERMEYWVEPHGAPNGCGADLTTFWVEVPVGAGNFSVYYGNKGFASYSSSGVFLKDGSGMFEDFEFEGSPMMNGWELEGLEHDTCTPLEPGKMGDPASFMTVDDIALSGSRSLSVDAFSKIGGSIKRVAAAGTTPLGKNFVLKGFFFDTGCHGYHYLSPDYDACMPVPNGKSMLPLKNAMGVYTDSKADQYCHTYPWITSGSNRSVAWHSFTFVGSDAKLELYVDDVLVTTDIPTDFSSMFIAGGAFVDDITSGSKAYWDALLVTRNIDGAMAELSADEEAVWFDEAHSWSRVGLTDPPPARQAHTAVVHSGSMYIFGGERSAYYYSDIWKYDFADDVWAFVAPRNSSAALGRHDHSAVVYDGVMYVYGGRSPTPKGDLWAYSFAEGTWTLMPASPGMAPRFGHGAAVLGTAMYVYGGYIAREDGMTGGLTDEVWSFNFTSRAWTKVGPRVDNFMEGADKAWIADPADAMQFPQELPPSRYSTVMLGRSDRAGFYVLGGAGGSDMMSVLGDVAGFHAGDKLWSFPNEDFRSVAQLSRYDAAGTLVDDMWACVHGGMADGKFLDSLVCAFVGDFGLEQQ